MALRLIVRKQGHAALADESQDTQITIDGCKVVVPQGEPKPKPNLRSSFNQSEYLVYQESQVRMRYLLTIEF